MFGPPLLTHWGSVCCLLLDLHAAHRADSAELLPVLGRLGLGRSQLRRDLDAWLGQPPKLAHERPNGLLVGHPAGAHRVREDALHGRRDLPSPRPPRLAGLGLRDGTTLAATMARLLEELLKELGPALPIGEAPVELRRGLHHGIRLPAELAPDLRKRTALRGPQPPSSRLLTVHRHLLVE